MKTSQRVPVTLFFKQVISIASVMTVVVFVLLRMIFHDLPFSFSEDGLVFLKIAGASFTVAFFVVALLHAMLLVSDRILVLWSQVKFKKDFRFPELFPREYVAAEQ